MFIVVILPFLAILSHVILIWYMGFFPGSIYFQETDHGSVLKGPENVTLLWSFINPFQIAVFIVIFAAYPTYTLIYPIVCRKYHKDYFKNIAVEY